VLIAPGGGSLDKEPTMAKSAAWVVKKKSPVHGWGLFAARFIPWDTAVLTCGGRKVTGDQVAADMRAMQIDHDLWLAEEPGVENLDDYLNHCCDPNIGFTDGSLTFHALRDIDAGEELTWHYSTSINEPGWGFACNCGSRHCKGRVVSYCDLDDADRKRLAGLTLAYLR
jgi:hypothetical protein